MNDNFIFVLEIIGTVAFAVSGVALGVKKNMDVFGSTMLGILTAVGGGVVRDLCLGRTPPLAFRDPIYVLLAAAVGLVFLFRPLGRLLTSENRHYERMLFLMDTVGLAVFTVSGVEAALRLAFMPDNLLLPVFSGVVTGVGGGILRDIGAMEIPAVYVKKVYAFASLLGALACALLWDSAGRFWASIACIFIVILIRILAAHYRWHLPHIKP